MQAFTRLEQFRRSRKIRPAVLAREANYSRQHLTEVRFARRDPRRKVIASIVSALRRITLEPIRGDDVFELTLEESGVWESTRLVALEARAAENARAVAMLQKLRPRPITEWKSILESEEDVDAAALARVLVLEARRAVENDPTAAAAFAQLATERAPAAHPEDSEYAAHLKGCAWLAYANALKHLGDYDSALSGLEQAEELLTLHVTSADELAQAWYVRASIFWKKSEFRAALLLSRRAERLFELVGDARRVMHAQILEAGIFFERGEHGAALGIWERVLEPLRESKERRVLATVWMNLGTVNGYLGNVTAGRAWLEKAAKEFARLGVKREWIRAQWSLGYLVGMHEARSRGLTLLRQAQSSYEELRMLLEAGFVGLDLSEVLLLRPEGAEEAAEVCAAILKRFQRAGLALAALKAVAFLCEAIRMRRASPPLVAYVRSYVHGLERNPSEEFAPPEVAG